MNWKVHWGTVAATRRIFFLFVSNFRLLNDDADRLYSVIKLSASDARLLVCVSLFVRMFQRILIGPASALCWVTGAIWWLL